MGRGKENLNKRGDNLGARNGSSASKKPKSGGCHRCCQTSTKRRNWEQGTSSQDMKCQAHFDKNQAVLIAKEFQCACIWELTVPDIMGIMGFT